MHETTRREFLHAMGALALVPLAGTEPDLILYNGNFWTVNAKAPRAQAVAISGGRFIAVGSNEDVLNLAAGRSRKIDFGQKTVLPGFIDAHTHPASSGWLHLHQVDCDLRSIAAIQAALRERAGKTPSDQWILGFKYDDTKTSDGRRLAVQDLDAAL
jgi:predicted amidohydrolase YtcJ